MHYYFTRYHPFYDGNMDARICKARLSQEREALGVRVMTACEIRAAAA
jgi:hypothetical protein